MREFTLEEMKQDLKENEDELQELRKRLESIKREILDHVELSIVIEKRIEKAEESAK